MNLKKILGYGVSNLESAKHGSSDNNTLKYALAIMGRCFEEAKAHASAGSSGWNFEVQRDNKNGQLISYWGKQPDIEKILKEATRE